MLLTILVKIIVITGGKQKKKSLGAKNSTVMDVNSLVEQWKC